MTTLLATPSPSLFDLGGEPTLDEVLASVWEGLIAHRVERVPRVQVRDGA